MNRPGIVWIQGRFFLILLFSVNNLQIFLGERYFYIAYGEHRKESVSHKNLGENMHEKKKSMDKDVVEIRRKDKKTS